MQGDFAEALKYIASCVIFKNYFSPKYLQVSMARTNAFI